MSREGALQGRALDLSFVPSGASSTAERVKPGKSSGPGQCHPDTGGCHRNWGLAVPLAGHGTHGGGGYGGVQGDGLGGGGWDKVLSPSPCQLRGWTETWQLIPPPGAGFESAAQIRPPKSPQQQPLA